MAPDSWKNPRLLRFAVEPQKKTSMTLNHEPRMRRRKQLDITTLSLCHMALCEPRSSHCEVLGGYLEGGESFAVCAGAPHTDHIYLGRLFAFVFAKDSGSAFLELHLPVCDLVGVGLKCRASSPSVLSPLRAARTTFALKAAV